MTVGVVLGLLLLARHFALRSGRAIPATNDAATATAGATTPTLGDPQRATLVRIVRTRLMGASVPDLDDDGAPGRRLLLVSLSRADRTALVVRGEGPTLAEAAVDAADRLALRADAGELREGRLKIDVAVEVGGRESFDGEGRAAIDRSLDGLWLPGPDLLLLPEELLARRLSTSDGDLQSKRLRRYLEEGGRQPIAIKDNPGRAGMPYHRVRFDSFMEVSLEVPEAAPARLYRGNRLEVEATPEHLLASVVAGAEYLLRHQRPDGNFGYNYLAKEDAYDDDYNLLRHAGTCYALLEVYQATGREDFLTAARRGIEALLEHVRGPRPEDADAAFEAIVSPDEEAKLGGAALAILALVEHQRATGDSRWQAQAERLARFLLFQQREDAGNVGRFHSKYFYGPPDPEPFESIYYPGEAILALARLSRLSGRPEHLEAARRGAAWLVEVRDADKSTADLPHDHWLLMALAELDELTGEARWRSHAERIARAIVEAQRLSSSHPDWIGSFYDPPRSTPTATRAEALVAMVRLADRSGLSAEPYLAALRRMAVFQLRCQLTPESAMYLARPDRAVGGFRRSLTDWEIRIDYVQHNLSALLGLRARLLVGRS